MEYISATNLRLDGRRRDEIRRIECKLGVNGNASGSASLNMGNTKVQCSVFGPKEPTFQSRADHRKSIVQCYWHLSKFARPQRSGGLFASRERGDLIAKTVEGVVLGNLLEKTEIDVALQFTECDGGELAAAVNCACLALIDAGIPLKDFIVACDVGLVKDAFLIDLNQTEMSANGPVLTMAILPNSGKVVTLELHRSANLELLNEMIGACSLGLKRIYEKLLKEVKLNTISNFESRKQ